MDKEDLIKLMKDVADGMRSYESIRDGGNLGTAIQGMLILNASKNIENGLIELGKSIEKTQFIPSPPHEIIS